jgi:hypothetical protein
MNPPSPWESPAESLAREAWRTLRVVLALFGLLFGLYCYHHAMGSPPLTPYGTPQAGANTARPVIPPAPDGFIFTNLPAPFTLPDAAMVKTVPTGLRVDWYRSLSDRGSGAAPLALAPARYCRLAVWYRIGDPLPRVTVESQCQ